jgi:hypothetical protein
MQPTQQLCRILLNLSRRGVEPMTSEESRFIGALTKASQRLWPQSIKQVSGYMLLGVYTRRSHQTQCCTLRPNVYLYIVENTNLIQ